MAARVPAEVLDLGAQAPRVEPGSLAALGQESAPVLARWESGPDQEPGLVLASRCDRRSMWR